MPAKIEPESLLEQVQCNDAFCVQRRWRARQLCVSFLQFAICQWQQPNWSAFPRELLERKVKRGQSAVVCWRRDWPKHLDGPILTGSLHAEAGLRASFDSSGSASGELRLGLLVLSCDCWCWLEGHRLRPSVCQDFKYKRQKCQECQERQQQRLFARERDFWKYPKQLWPKCQYARADWNGIMWKSKERKRNEFDPRQQRNEHRSQPKQHLGPGGLLASRRAANPQPIGLLLLRSSRMPHALVQATPSWWNWCCID